MPERNFCSREPLPRPQDDLGLDQLSQDLDTILQDSMRNLQSLRGHDVDAISSFIPTDDELLGRSGEPGSLISALDELVDTPVGSYPAAQSTRFKESASHRPPRHSTRQRRPPSKQATAQSTNRNACINQTSNINRTKRKPPVAPTTSSRAWRPAGSTHRSPPPCSSQPLARPASARSRRNAPASAGAKAAASKEDAKRVQLRIVGLQNALKNSGKKIVELEDELEDARAKLHTVPTFTYDCSSTF